MLIFPVGTSNVSVNVQVVDDEGLPVANLTAVSFPPLLLSAAGGAPTALPVVDLASFDAAHTPGGLLWRAGGDYRYDLPDEYVNSTGTRYLTGEATNKRVLSAPIQVMPTVSADTFEAIRLGAAAIFSEVFTAALEQVMSLVRESLAPRQVPTRTYSVNTRVRVVDAALADFGRTAVVSAVNGPNSYVIRFADGRTTAVVGTAIAALPDVLQPPAPAQHGFVVLARVRVVDPVHSAYNRVGTVLSRENDLYQVQVPWIGGETRQFALKGAQLAAA